MLRGENIICVAFPSWEGNYMKSTVQLMTELSKENRVLYVDYLYTIKDLLTGNNDLSAKRILGLEPRIEKKLDFGDGQLYLLHPPAIFPTNFIKNESLHQTIYASQAKRIVKSISKAAHQLGFNNPIVINAFNPLLGQHTLGKFNEKAHFYYCYDEISQANWTKHHGGEAERKFMQMVDGAFFTSKALLESKKHLNSNYHLVENGVDFDLFNKAWSPKNINYSIKTIGYIGSIDDRLDLELIERLAEAFPWHQIKLVGRVVSKRIEKALEKWRNVTLPGPHSSTELINQLRYMSLGIVPFVKDEFTRNIYPLKLNEYLAAGKPVVSTNFTNLSEFNDVVRVTHNHDQFIAAVDEELNHDSIVKASERMALAQSNSWEQRAKDLSFPILHHLNQE